MACSHRAAQEKPLAENLLYTKQCLPHFLRWVLSFPVMGAVVPTSPSLPLTHPSFTAVKNIVGDQG